MIAFALQALAFAKRLPREVWYLVAAALVAWLLYRAGWNARDERADREMAAVIEAQDKAREAQIAVNRAAQERYDTLAERIDHEAVQTRVVVRDATTAYIDRNRVQDRVCSASGASAPATGDSAREPVDVPAGFVLVAESDVRACGEWQAYGVTAHEFLMGLE